MIQNLFFAFMSIFVIDKDIFLNKFYIYNIKFVFIVLDIVYSDFYIKILILLKYFLKHLFS